MLLLATNGQVLAHDTLPLVAARRYYMLVTTPHYTPDAAEFSPYTPLRRLRFSPRASFTMMSYAVTFFTQTLRHDITLCRHVATPCFTPP